MEISSRKNSLKSQLAGVFSFAEESLPEWKRIESSRLSEDLLFGASFKIPSRPRSKPSTNPERSINRERIAPVTPSKDKSQVTNSENEVRETNSVERSLKRKKYKPKVVGDGASKAKTATSDLKFTNLKAPTTPDLKPQCRRVPITPVSEDKRTPKTNLSLETLSTAMQLNNDGASKPTKSVRRQLNYGLEEYLEPFSYEETGTASNLNPDNSILAINLNFGDVNEQLQTRHEGLQSGPDAENKPVVHENDISVATKCAEGSTGNTTNLNCQNMVKPAPLVENGLIIDLGDKTEADMHGAMHVGSDFRLNQGETGIVKCLMEDFGLVVLRDNLIQLAAQRTRGVKRRRAKKSTVLSLNEMLEDIVLKMTNLKLYENALVLYQGKKGKCRGIVALDEDSLIEWNILMGEDNVGSKSEPEREERWWKERDNFRNLAEGFISKMKLIQGDRRFSEWKGSVVDSVVGAFLTQNVSDQLSSSAFISLCARYPRRRDVDVTRTEQKFPDCEGTESHIVNKQTCAADIVDSHIECRPQEVSKDSPNIELTKEITGSPKVKENDVPKDMGFKNGVEHFDWDALRKVASLRGREGRSVKTEDAADWDAVRNAKVSEIAKAIHGRGQDNVLAERIKNFLNRVVKEHGSMDLEWLRDTPGDKAKEYLLSIYGLGLKSVECVRLLALHQVAFPVDTNVGRIAVRLGWVPLQPLPESVSCDGYYSEVSLASALQARPRNIVFCTKSKPNCNACPLRSDCKHFASAFASSRLTLPGPQDNNVVLYNGAPTALKNASNLFLNPTDVPTAQFPSLPRSSECEPIIEEPMTPEEEQIVEEIPDIEDLCFDDPDEIPTINLNMESLVRNIEELVRNNNSELQIEDISKALVLLPPIAASVPPPRLKHTRFLHTVHEAYELPDGHPILGRFEFEERDPSDPSPYLLILYSPEKSGAECKPCLCNSCNEAKSRDVLSEEENNYVKCSFMIPCRTAMRGSFPLNGTYFQVNEVFADHCTARNPLMVPTEEIWRLRRRHVYFGSTVSSILKGLPTDEIQYCFWRGFVCVREFDRRSRYPRPMSSWLHLPTIKKKVGSAQ